MAVFLFGGCKLVADALDREQGDEGKREAKRETIRHGSEQCAEVDDNRKQVEGRQRYMSATF